MTDFPFATLGFDLDGTLIDTLGDLAAALNHTLRLAGRPAIPLPEVRALIGGGTARMLARGLERTGGLPDDETLAGLQAELIGFYEANIAVHSRLYPGGEAMLDALAARGVKLAVVTNKLEHLARRLLSELGLDARFAAIIGGDTLGPGKAKPAPDLLLAMVERCGPGRAAFVGDTTFDTRAAAAAGLPCVAVSFGFCDLVPHEMGADVVIDHFDQLEGALLVL